MSRPWWLDGTKDLVLIGCLVVVAYLLIWQASQPNVVAIADARTEAAVRQVVALQTQVARLPAPTARPCQTYYEGHGYGC